MDKQIKEFIKKLYEKNGFEYDESKDLYSNFASQYYNLPYEDCCEFKNGKPFPEGKKVRLEIKEMVCHKYYSNCESF